MSRFSTGTSSKKHALAHMQWFSGDLFEPTLNVNTNLTNLLFSNSTKPRKWSVYGYIGVGFTNFRSVRYKLVKDDDTDPIVKYEGYNGYDLKNMKVKRTSEVVVPLGLGVKYNVTPNLGITFDLSGHYMQSDKLDAFATGNSNDIYQYTSLGVVYNFSNKYSRPESQVVVEQVAKVSELIDGFGDKDGDGIADKYDKDNNTAKGAKVYGDGTSVDTDGDGVPDYMDQERFSANGAKVNENGVEVDSDGDGVGDSRDMEPNTAKGAQVDFKGVTIQTASSGIVAPKGEAGASYTPSGLPSIYFQVNSTVVEYNNYPAMTTVAQALKANPKLKLVVVGHADNVGSPEYNKKLAQRRADAVVAHLVKVYGIDKARLSTDSKGNADVLTKGKGSIVDRRVDFSIGK
ncbi:MAG: OmpA family protein [Flavobacteriales bacterium]